MSARETLHLTDEQLDDYVDGAMDVAQRATADAHLASCERCRHAIDATRALLATVARERAAITAPPELWPLVASSTVHLAAVHASCIDLPVERAASTSPLLDLYGALHDTLDTRLFQS